MSFAELQRSIAHDALPPAGMSGAILALWYDARGDWDQAHTAAQADEGRDCAWVHAYLHRKEGDLGNAGYWYRRASHAMPAKDTALAAEWEQIARALVAR